MKRDLSLLQLLSLLLSLSLLPSFSLSSPIRPFNPPQDPTFTFFHISDIHYDPLSNPVLYNTSTFCRPETYLDRLKEDDHDHPIKSSNHLVNINVPNYYGRYGCDTPITLFNSTLTAMSQVQPNPDFILFTGDSPAHKLVEAEQIDAINFVADSLRELFPGVLVIPSIGNNDVYPDYNLTCNDPTLQMLQQAYQDWIPSDQASTYLTMGAFAVSPLPSLLVISLDTILYAVRNTNFNGSQADPCGQFAWLNGQLNTARSQGMTVYIIGHILPGMDPDFYIPLWTPDYTTTFIELVLTYTDVIGGMFFGHIHRDEFRMLVPPPSSKEKSKISSQITSLVTGSSFSPIFDNNPSFRLYSYNKSYTLLDYDEIYIDLYLSNLYGDTNWTLIYSYSDYEEGPIGTSSLGALLTKLQSEPSLFSTWYDRRVALYQSSQQAALCVVSSPDDSSFDNCIIQGTKKR